METNIERINQPKTKGAALNQILFIENQRESILRKKENLMNSITNTRKKIAKLSETLDSYERQLENLNKRSSDWKSQEDKILLDYAITTSEVLEIKSSLLRTKLKTLEAQQNTSDVDDALNELGKLNFFQD